jgi:hypothetical protein
MKPDINEGLRLTARLLAGERSDIYPDYYTTKHLIKLTFYTPDECKRIIVHTFKNHSKN